MRARALLAALLLLPVPLPQASEEGCRPLPLKEERIGDERVYRLDDRFALRIGSDAALDTPTDYGPRLMLTTPSGRRFASKGSRDSYGMRPTFVANCGGNQVLILGEIGTEYSWGVRVFSYNQGEVRDLGDLPFAVADQADAESVVPFMRFARRNGAAVISFTRDLIRNPGSPNETKVAKDRIRYRVSRDKLSELRR